MPENIIFAKNIQFGYHSQLNREDSKQKALENISFSVKKGEFVVILGHNGSGKSTIAKHLNAILKADSGELLIANMDPKDEYNISKIRTHVGMVFQNPENQIIASIVEEDVAFSLENMGIERSEIRRRVNRVLKEVDMSEYIIDSVNNLSGGQKQKVAIAGILAIAPDCIIMDESTAMLDPQGRKDVLNTVHKLNKENGTTIILITHYMEEAVDADRVIVMDKGTIILEDIPKQVFSQVEKLKEVGLDVPQVTEFAFELKKRGIDIGCEIITEEECAEALLKFLKHK